MGERNFARPRLAAAANEASVGDGVVRRPERPLGYQRLVTREEAGDAIDARDHQRLVGRERRQDRWHRPGEKRLAGAGGTDHEDVMAAGGSDFETALDVFLAADIGEVGAV